MAGYYADAEKYQISRWLLGCIEKEIGDHVIAERERIIKIISEWDLPVNQGTYTVDDSVKSLIALIKEKK